MYMHKGDILSS